MPGYATRSTARPQAALAGGLGAGPQDQPQLFSTPPKTRTSDDYWTPAWLFNALGVTFDIDVASPPGGSPWVPAKKYYTKTENGLEQPWHGRVWMNPPYSKASPWVNKFLNHGNGIALTVVSKSKWFDAAWNNPNVAFVSLPQSFEFAQGRIPFPTILWAIGQHNIEAISRIGLAR